MTTYPQDTDPTPETTYKVYADNQGYEIVFQDRNGWKHALFTWADGSATFQWKTTWTEPDDTQATDVPVALQKLADAWQEYLDAVVEKE